MRVRVRVRVPVPVRIECRASDADCGVQLPYAGPYISEAAADQDLNPPNLPWTSRTILGTCCHAFRDKPTPRKSHATILDAQDGILISIQLESSEGQCISHAQARYPLDTSQGASIIPRTPSCELIKGLGTIRTNRTGPLAFRRTLLGVL